MNEANLEGSSANRPHAQDQVLMTLLHSLIQVGSSQDLAQNISVRTAHVLFVLKQLAWVSVTWGERALSSTNWHLLRAFALCLCGD